MAVQGKNSSSSFEMRERLHRGMNARDELFHSFQIHAERRGGRILDLDDVGFPTWSGATNVGGAIGQINHGG